MSALLEVDGLSITLPLAQGELNAVSDVSFTLNKGETLGIVGESGSGKSLSSLAVMGLLSKSAKVNAKSLRFDGQDLLDMDEKSRAKLRGNRIAMIFQEPMTSLNPVYSIGRQMTEVLMLHKKVSMAEARKRAIYLLGRVGITSAEHRLKQYPHELSGGLRQRVMIAMALMCEPDLIIADEPTTALDVTVQAQILLLLQELQQEFKMAIIFIAHDMGVVARVSDRVSVMYAGQIIETGKASEMFRNPVHPYTKGLMESIPVPGQIEPGQHLGSIPGMVPSLTTKILGCHFAGRCRYKKNACEAGDIPFVALSESRGYRCILPPEETQLLMGMPRGEQETGTGSGDLAYGEDIDHQSQPILSVVEAECEFRVKQAFFSPATPLRAVGNVSLDLRKGEVLALVGESGCGKSTLAKIMLGLQKPTAGDIRINGQSLKDVDLKELSRRVQPIFQDPYSSLNPRKTIGEIIRRPLVIHGIGDAEEQKTMVDDVMEKVGLPKRFYHNYPNQLSGGQRQRVAVARALITKPDIVICDEPTSALDVSVQAQILNLLLDLREEMGLTYLLITHDMAVVEHIATRVAIMYLGQIVEISDTKSLFKDAKHPYSRVLLDSVLTPEAELGVPGCHLVGSSYPNPINPPSGCKFHPRCEKAMGICKSQAPIEVRTGNQLVSCHLYAQTDPTSIIAKTG
ncbi:ABC transporter ATP-binding protein [uncultured Oceanisphaera sp.]|uniref:dipeptide ABC transporter ATP-binding protein n=1 Tax=uncultured Oceanisphaera sp. TaxID=353858 RepID=UPI0026381D70|nr:ABC transporter ATP-binding protein [uncultured Oceanisphaera sp.]